MEIAPDAAAQRRNDAAAQRSGAADAVAAAKEAKGNDAVQCGAGSL